MNFYASVLRTVVPLLVGWILTSTGAIGLELDSATVAAGVTAAVSGVYYLVLRSAEQLAARLEWEPVRLLAGAMIGWAAPPDYRRRDGAPSLREVR